jgi:hypothetical protein
MDTGGVVVKTGGSRVLRGGSEVHSQEGGCAVKKMHGLVVAILAAVLLLAAVAALPAASVPPDVVLVSYGFGVPPGAFTKTAVVDGAVVSSATAVTFVNSSGATQGGSGQSGTTRPRWS